MSQLGIIGYSGHAYVVCDIFTSQGQKVNVYFEEEEKSYNPFGLTFLGSERSNEAYNFFKKYSYFIAIGNNEIREKVYNSISVENNRTLLKAIHLISVISPLAKIGKGTMIGSNVTINTLTEIGNGVICNTGCIIEHECQIGHFAHIAPGATLAGNVTIGERSFIGANSVVKQGIVIGKDVTVGAGTVVIKNIPDGATVVGNPGKIIKTII